MRKDEAEDNIIESILIAIEESLKRLSFNRYVDGVIQSVNDDGTYDVKINSGTSKLKPLREATYKVGDVVFVLVKNNNYSFKYIDCKKP